MHAGERVRASVEARISHELGHPRVWITIRIVAGVWLLVLAGVLYAYDVGGWWRALLVPAGLLHFYWAFILHHDAAGRKSG